MPPIRGTTVDDPIWAPSRKQQVFAGFTDQQFHPSGSECGDCHKNKLENGVLGTLSTALARDWQHLDLDVTEEDLERRGPGLVLDEEGAGGRRLMLWTD